MWRLSLHVMLIAVICVCVLSGIPSSMSKYVNKREKEQRYCGSKLADKLREVCNGTYESMDKKMKRDLDTLQWIQSHAEEVVSNTKFPFRPRSIANKFKNRSLRRQKRTSGGVADECCINKGCTIGELREYCAER